MRLLHTTTLVFSSSVASGGDSSTPYAVLSHRWAADSESEVLFEDILSEKALEKPCYQKIQRAAGAARVDGFEWIWIDTYCINKQSSAELTESINSMYMWYQNAGCCYVYLQDVHTEAQFSKSNWFERGWTLQELLGPRSVKFYNRNWKPLGTKGERVAEISEITGIDGDALLGRELHPYSIAQKMSWAALRVTTRPEDLAYCLLGLFGVNIVPIYGEGAEKAFIRLQEEIIKQDDDHSIFAWSMDSTGKLISGLLAPEPRCFRNCSARRSPLKSSGRTPFSMTNRGLSIELEITPWATDTYLAFIESHNEAWQTLGIYLRRLHEDDQYVRIKLDGQDGVFVGSKTVYPNQVSNRSSQPIRKRRVLVRQYPTRHHSVDCSSERANAFQIAWSCERTGQESPEILHTVRLDPPWELKTLDLPSRTEFRQIAVGYDFDLNPVCLLKHIISQTRLKPPIIIENGNGNDGEVKEVKVGSRHYLEHNQDGDSYGPNDGVWYVRGSRRMDTFQRIQPYYGSSCKVVSMCRDDDDSMMWVVEINT